MKLLVIFILVSSIAINSYAQENINTDTEINTKPAVSDRLSMYKDNYFITGFSRDENLNKQIKYQFSIKYRFNAEDGKLNIYFIHTQKHFWDIYTFSSPFRETNFSPGLMLFFDLNKLLNRQSPWLRNLEIIPELHQSNGEIEERNRSWNRAIINFNIYEGGLCFNDARLKIAYSPYAIWGFNFEEEYNGDIYKYSMNSLSLMIRDLQTSKYKELFGVDIDLYAISGYKKAYTATLSGENIITVGNFNPAHFTFIGDLKIRMNWLGCGLFFQICHGYSDSLIRYNEKETRGKIGFTLLNNDFLSAYN